MVLGWWRERGQTLIPGLYPMVLHAGLWNLTVGSLFYLVPSDYTRADTLPCPVHSTPYLLQVGQA